MRVFSTKAWLPTLLLAGFLCGCGDEWNNPYPTQDGGKNILYSAFTERPKHLDPVQSYSEDEAEFNAQIYEPPLQYHYLKRPYVLIPLAAEGVPRPRTVDAAGRDVPADSARVAQTLYEIHIRPGILFQPHPAFARGESGDLLYHSLTREDLKDIYSLRDFPRTGTRELTAEDYIYQIKRLALPRIPERQAIGRERVAEPRDARDVGGAGGVGERVVERVERAALAGRLGALDARVDQDRGG